MFLFESGVVPLVPQHIEIVRIINICLGTVAGLCLLYSLMLNWNYRSTAEKLRWLSVFLFILSGTYGTFEAAYLQTYIRAYMVTVSLLWAIMAALWPAGEPELSDGT